MTDLLQEIQHLQFTERSRAEALLRNFINDTFPFLKVRKVQLRPQAVSLNSFNGFLTLEDEKRLFFKTHTEQDNVIGEYYNAKLLAEAGYPVIQPLYSSTSAGQHLLIYEVIESPSVFELAWNIEQGIDNRSFERLKLAQNSADYQLMEIYRQTLHWQSNEANRKAPIHQLFIHRLLYGRLQRFYGPGQIIHLPGNISITTDDLFRKKWVINGQEYAETLGAVIDRISQNILSLEKMTGGNPAIVGHGDAHNGNVFFQENGDDYSLLYFDPAFAGQHHPLLDLAKPLFHNVFAMWMYYPVEQLNRCQIKLESVGDVWQVDYEYQLHSVRHMFLRSKIDYVLMPILKELKGRGWLVDNWREFLKAALFCCPFLTLNLADSERFPPEISLLGLAMSMEMGSESRPGNKSMIDELLSEVADGI
jgi:hypothetical protein